MIMKTEKQYVVTESQLELFYLELEKARCTVFSKHETPDRLNTFKIGWESGIDEVKTLINLILNINDQ